MDDEALLNRLLGRINKTDTCWLWQGHASPLGYGQATVQRKSRYVHRLMAAAFFGPRPAGMDVRHLNDVRDDNRLTNLAYGTRTQNAQDSLANGSHFQTNKTHCIHGHPFDEANTRYKHAKDGAVIRLCIACCRRNGLAHYYRQKAKKA